MAFSLARRICSTRLRSAVMTSECIHRYSTVNGSASRDNPIEQSNFLEQFFQNHTPPSQAVEYFSSKEWTRTFFHDESYELVPFFSQHHNEGTGENHFFGQIVNTETTIPHLLAFRRRSLNPSADDLPFKGGSQPISGTATPSDVFALLSLERGLNAHPSIVHGGFQCVLFDEIARFLILVHQNASAKPGPRHIHYTLSMTARYVAPVATPADVLVRAKLRKVEGRKWFTYAEIVNHAGQVLTSSESLWLTAKQQ